MPGNPINKVGAAHLNRRVEKEVTNRGQSNGTYDFVYDGMQIVETEVKGPVYLGNGNGAGIRMVSRRTVIE